MYEKWLLKSNSNWVFNTVNYEKSNMLHNVGNKTYISSAKFSQYTAKRPNINLFIIRKSQNNLRCTVRSRLDIWTQMICFKATASQINDFYFTSTVAFNKNILRLQITVYETKAMQKLKCLQTLNCYWLHRFKLQECQLPKLKIHLKVT